MSPRAITKSTTCPTAKLPVGNEAHYDQDRIRWRDIIKAPVPVNGTRLDEIQGTQVIFLGTEDLKKLVCEIDGVTGVRGIMITLGYNPQVPDPIDPTVSRKKLVPYVSSANLNGTVPVKVKLFQPTSLSSHLLTT